MTPKTTPINRHIVVIPYCQIARHQRRGGQYLLD
jgi:hypothetical protein